MAFNFGFGQSKQKSQSYSGLRGTPQFAQFAADYGGLAGSAANLSRRYANSPFGYFQGQHVDTLAPINEFGLPPQLTSGLNSVVSQLYSKASAGGAGQGMLSPENTQGIIGSSLNNIGMFLTPYVLDYAKYRQTLPEQLMASRLGFLQNTLGSMAPGLGSESKYTGSQIQVSGGYEPGKT